MTSPAAGVAGGPSRIVRLGLFIVTGSVAAVVGAYIDWLWWPHYSGLMLTILAGVILVAGVIVALISRRTVRRSGLLIVVVAVGLVVGQNLGPDREPLIYQGGGTMTLRLASPTVATATGAADCTNVASQTEFQVTGDPNMRLDTPARPFLTVYLTVGDRWQAIDDAPRKDGIRFAITTDVAQIPADGKPVSIGMQATEASTIEASFSNAGGSLSFAGLQSQSGPDDTGESLDYAGTLEWTCGAVVSETEGG